MAAQLAVQGTTAQFPGVRLEHAVARLLAGTSEPWCGAIGVAHVQICPQTPGHLDEAAAEALRASCPATQFRTHANARVLDRLHVQDLSTVEDATMGYFRELADRNRRMGAKVVSLHAGVRTNATMSQMLDARQRLQDEIFGDIEVAVEAMYPSARTPHLVASWGEYEHLLRSGAPLAIDLSHIAITAQAAGSVDMGLIRALCEHALEIHVSTNDGVHDSHDVLAARPAWWSVLETAGLRTDCVIFTEGRQVASRTITE